MVQDIQSAAAAIPLQYIRTICDLLQFFQHKDRHHDRTFQKSSLENICHTSIDDDIRIQQLADALFFL